MATNHTQNYQLNLWEPGDSFLREEFNENSQKLDAALKAEADARAAGDAALQTAVNGKADAAALNALTQTVSKKLEFISGTYVGTGEYNTDHPTSLDFAQATGGKPPLLVMVAPVNGNDYCFWAIRGQQNAYVHDLQSVASYPTCHLTWTNTGLSWHANYASYQMNSKDESYVYLAIF